MNKKVVVIIAIIAFLFIITAGVCIFIQNKNTKPNDINTPEYEEPEVIEDTEDDIRPVPEFKDVSGSKIESTESKPDENDYNEYFYESVRDMLMSDANVKSWNKDIEFTLDNKVEYTDTVTEQYLYGSIANTDAVFIIDMGTDSDTDETFGLYGVSNKYGSDYSMIYWENGVPSDAMDIYELIASYGLSDSYVANTVASNQYNIQNTRTGEISMLYKEEGQWFWTYPSSEDEGGDA